MNSLVKFGFTILVVFVVQNSKAAPANTETDSENWPQRKLHFYAQTRFNLTESNVRLFGGKFWEIRQGHLPFWFSFDLYKTVFNKQYSNPTEELKREHTFIRTCVRTLKARVLYRILAGTRDTYITQDADQSYEEAMNSGDGKEDEGVEGISISYRVEPEETDEKKNESPIEKAIRLVSAELSKVESRNQLENYLDAFDEVDGSAIEGKLPY